MTRATRRDGDPGRYQPFEVQSLQNPRSLQFRHVVEEQDGKGIAEAIQPARLAVADAGRTQEKVLRIVFQPYIDERGRLHEASAVHAVVARGEWQQQALMQASLPPRRTAAAASALPESLADAVDRADPPLEGLAVADPNAPDRGVVPTAVA